MREQTNKRFTTSTHWQATWTHSPLNSFDLALKEEREYANFNRVAVLESWQVTWLLKRKTPRLRKMHRKSKMDSTVMLPSRVADNPVHQVSLFQRRPLFISPIANVQVKTRTKSLTLILGDTFSKWKNYEYCIALIQFKESTICANVIHSYKAVFFSWALGFDSYGEKVFCGLCSHVPFDAHIYVHLY